MPRFARTEIRRFVPARASAALALAAALAASCATGNDNQGTQSGTGGAQAAGSGGGSNGAGGAGGAATGVGGTGGSTSSSSTASAGGSGGASTDAGGSGGPGGTGGASTGGGGEGGMSVPDAGSDAGGIFPDAGCATFTAEAQLAPAAMLIVLDKSASMTKQNKWGTAQLAVVSAIDKDVFDTMSLGLVTFPASFTQPPSCLCDYCCLGDPSLCQFAFPQGVSCGVSALPQVALAPAGKNKSNMPPGVRNEIYQYLVKSAPLSNGDDGSPIYDALVAGYNALKAYNIDKRILVLITDGGFSCTSVASPPRPGYSDGACNDWEYPDTVNALITSARTDPQKPIFTFIVGVPGSNSNGQMLDGFATAPYSMRLALSTYAVSGSPDTVDPACDKNAVFTKNGPPPAVPCHLDLSNGAQFDADALAKAIAEIRGKALGCVYDLPEPPAGKVIDLDKVNVQVTVNGVPTLVPKRVDPLDTCLADPCWDYNDKQQVELIGKACSDLTEATTAKVDIVVGCETIHK